MQCKEFGRRKARQAEEGARRSKSRDSSRVFSISRLNKAEVEGSAAGLMAPLRKVCGPAPHSHIQLRAPAAVVHDPSTVPVTWERRLSTCQSCGRLESRHPVFKSRKKA